MICRLPKVDILRTRELRNYGRPIVGNCFGKPRSGERIYVFSLLLLVALASAATAADWPGYRGPHRDGICSETGLVGQWPAEGPKPLWRSKEIGEGYSGLAVHGSMAYTMGQRDGREWVIALDVVNGGQILWATPIGYIRHNGSGHPGPRSTPSFYRDRVYALGMNGDLVAINAMTGEGIWSKNLVAEFGGTIPKWGYSESPLVDGRWIVCTPGGSRATMVALWRVNGEKVWACPIGDGAAYSSVVKASIGNVHQYVQFTERGVVGVKVRGGELLWRWDKPASETANINTPVWFGQTVFASTGDAGGGVVYPEVNEQGEFTASEIYFVDHMKNAHGGMIYWDGYLYGTSEPDVLTCIDYKTGKVHWTDDTSGKCSLLFADGMLYARSDKGQMSLVRATPDGFELKGRYSEPGRTRRPTWTAPVIADGRLFLRNQNQLLCYGITPEANEPEETE